jgi:hypothetical protein
MNYHKGDYVWLRNKTLVRLENNLSEILGSWIAVEMKHSRPMLVMDLSVRNNQWHFDGDIMRKANIKGKQND